MTERLQGQVALVTGGGAGIGQAICQAFARQGAKVAILDLKPGLAQNVCAELEEEGAEGTWCQANVTSSEEIDEAVSHILEKWGRIDILVNNAGIMAPASGPTDSVLETDRESWETMLQVNLNSVFLVSNRVMPEMARSGGGKVINMASMYGLVTNYRRLGYTTTKGAIVAMTRSMALDAIEENINVNAIAPGYVRTERLEKRMEDPAWREEILERGIPMGRLAELEEIANVALFLAGPESNYMVGQTLVVDGGWTLR